MINTASNYSDNAYAQASRQRKAAIGTEFYNQFQQLVKGRGGLVLLRSMFETLKQLLGEYDHDFIAQLIFPEHYPPARYPLHFPIPTCVFETVEYGFVQPSPTGGFSIMCYPKRLGSWPDWNNARDAASGSCDTNGIIGWSGAVEIGKVAGLCSPAVELYNGTGWKPDNWGTWTGVFPPDDIGMLYQSIRLAGCCLRLQYMNRLDEVSGFLTSCVDYKHDAAAGSNIVQIDYGLYKRVTHPLEGVRAVWFPKDVTDEEFEDYPSWIVSNQQTDDYNVAGTEAIKSWVYMCPRATGVGLGTYENLAWDSDLGVRASTFNSPDSVYRVGYMDTTTNSPYTGTGVHRYTLGKTMDGTSRMDTDAIMIYGTGLPVSVGNQFRLELIRHWEGIPLQKFRQYLYGERPFTSQGSYDMMKSVGNFFPFFGTLTNVEAQGMRDVVNGRLNELNPGSLQAGLSGGGDVITTIAQALG